MKTQRPLKIREMVTEIMRLVGHADTSATRAYLSTDQASKSHARLTKWLIADLIACVVVSLVLVIMQANVIRETRQSDAQIADILSEQTKVLDNLNTNMARVENMYDNLNNRVSLYVPGYTKYLYYNQTTGKVEVYNIAQARYHRKGNCAQGYVVIENGPLPIADLEKFLSTHKAK